jgi:hypothetical protein
MTAPKATNTNQKKAAVKRRANTIYTEADFGKQPIARWICKD